MHSMMPQTKQQKVFLFLCLIFVLEGFSNSSKRVPYRDIKPIKKRSGGWIGSLWSGNSTSGSTLARLEPRQRQNTCYSFCRTAFKWKNKGQHFLVCLKSENGFLCSWYVVFCLFSFCVFSDCLSLFNQRFFLSFFNYVFFSFTWRVKILSHSNTFSLLVWSFPW